MALKIVFNPFTGNLDWVQTSSTSIVSDLVLESVTCDSSVAVGDIVRFDGSEFIKAQADSFANSRAVGVCESKDSATVCDVRIAGETGSIFTGLDPNNDYFLSSSVAGEVSTTFPTSSGEVIVFIGRPISTTAMVLNIEHRLIRG